MRTSTILLAAALLLTACGEEELDQDVITSIPTGDGSGTVERRRLSRLFCRANGASVRVAEKLCFTSAGIHEQHGEQGIRYELERGDRRFQR